MSKQTYKILIIDDSAEDRVTFRCYLEQNGECIYEFLEAELGDEGVAVCLESKPDCVLLDYNLPDSDGLSVLKAINPDPIKPNFAVVLLTVSGSEAIAVNALKNGAQDYLVKGKITAEDLHLSISKAIEITRLRQENLKTTEELRQSKELLTIGANVADFAVCEIDYATNINHLSKEAARLFGLGEEEMNVSRDAFHATFHPDERDEMAKLIEESLNPDGDGWFAREHRIILPNGEVRRLNVRKQIFFDRAQNPPRPVRGILAAQDITARKRQENELRESEEHLRLATEAAEMYSWEIDLSDRTIKFADNQAQVLGFALPENYTEAMAFVHSVDRADADRAFDAEIKNTETFETEFRLIHPHTGAAVWVCTTGVVITDAHGLPVRLVGVTQNITSRKVAEEKLLAGDERMRLATKATGVGVWEWNVITNQIRWDSEMFRIYGIEPTEDGFVQYEDWSGSVLPEDLPELDVLQDTLQRCGNSRREFRIRRRNDGAVREIEAVETVRPNAQGQAEWVVGTNLDVTERKLAAEELRENQRFTESIIETAPSVIYLFDLNTKQPTYLTRQAAELIGYSFNEVKGEQGSFMQKFMHPDDTRRAQRHFRQLQQTHNGEMFEFEYRMQHKSGEWRWFRSRDRIFKRDENGKPAEILGIAFDITERKKAEEELKASEEFNRIVLESSPDCVKILDGEGRLQYMNVNGLCLLEIDDFTPCQNEFWWNLWQEESQPLVKDAVKKARRGETVKFEAYSPTTKGTPKWWDIIVSPISSADGKPQQLISVSRDITERKYRELNLAFLANVQKDFVPLSSATAIMKVVSERLAEYLNVPRCLFVEINETADIAEVIYDYYAADLSSLIGTYKLSEFHTEEERSYLSAGTPLVINDVRDEPRSAEAAANFDALGIRALANAPYLSNGRWKFVLGVQHHQPHQWRKDEVELLTEMAERIYVRLERARAEAKLRESEERFRALFNSIDEGFCIIEMIFDEHNKPFDYRFEQINPAFSRLTGLPESAVGKTMLEFVPDLENFWFETYGKVVLTGEPVRFENEAVSMNRWFEVYASRIGGNDSRRCAIVFNNITDRKTTELEREKLLIREQELRREAEKTNRAKDEFLAMLSHELRSPLNSMLGWTQILQSNKLNAEKTAQAIETIARNVRLQNALIEDILDVSRIVSGKMRLESETVSLFSIVQSALETARPAAEKQGVKIESDFDAGDYEVFGDRHRLQQIINNLLTNAIKFTPGGGSIKVQLRREDTWAKLIVEDSGIGIEPDLLPQIFDRFKQADASSTRKFGGLGLGLAIVKHLVELHGGTISAYSDGAQQGATFTVRLPLAATILPQNDFALAASAKVNISTRPKSLLNLHILLVDDDPDALNLMSFVLESNGAKTVCAESAAEALLKLEENRFDLLISDLGMAEMDGYELIRQLRESEKNDVKILPAIALTGYVSTEDRSRVLAAGFHEHLPKPVNIENLPNVILNLLKNENALPT